MNMPSHCPYCVIRMVLKVGLWTVPNLFHTFFSSCLLVDLGFTSPKIADPEQLWLFHMSKPSFVSWDVTVNLHPGELLPLSGWLWRLFSPAYVTIPRSSTTAVYVLTRLAVPVEMMKYIWHVFVPYLLQCTIEDVSGLSGQTCAYDVCVRIMNTYPLSLTAWLHVCGWHQHWSNRTQAIFHPLRITRTRRWI